MFGVIIFLLARICTINAINDLGTLVYLSISWMKISFVVVFLRRRAKFSLDVKKYLFENMFSLRILYFIVTRTVSRLFAGTGANDNVNKSVTAAVICWQERHWWRSHV